MLVICNTSQVKLKMDYGMDNPNVGSAILAFLSVILKETE
jgi:hypothetical protein